VNAIAERVADGAAFLDKHDAGWWDPDADEAIDLDTLDLGNTRLCVLGQRCPLEVLSAYSDSACAGERYAAYAAHLTSDLGIDRFRWAMRMGFNGDTKEYDDLTAEWKRVITARREAAP